MLRTTFRSLLSRKLRLALSGLAVLLAVTFMSGAFVLRETLQRSLDGVFAGTYQGVDVQVSAKPLVDDEESAPPALSAATLDRIRAVAGVGRVTGLVSVDGVRVVGRDGKVLANGQGRRTGTNWTGVRGPMEMRAGNGPGGPDEIAVNARLADAAGVAVGGRLTVLAGETRQAYTVVGVFGYRGGRDALGGEEVVSFDGATAQRLLLGRTGLYTAAQVDTAPGEGATAVRNRLRAELGAQYTVDTGADLAKQAAARTGAFLTVITRILLGFAAVAVLVGTFLIINTFSIIVAQRTRELALLRALGGSRGQVLGSVLVEAFVVGLVASAAGVGAGIGVGALAARLLARGAGGLKSAAFAVPVAGVWIPVLVGTAVTVLAALVPAMRAARIAPVAALREAQDAARPMTRLGIAGGLGAALGALLLGYGLSGRAHGATMSVILAGVLLAYVGVALLTPLFSRPVVGVLGRAFAWSVPGELGRRNSARNPRRTAITASALMIGVALVTAGSTVGNSLKASVTDVFGEQVRADLVIIAENGGSIVTGDLLDRIRALDPVDVVAGSAADRAKINGAVESVEAYDDQGAGNLLLSHRAVEGRIDGLSGGQLVLSAGTAKRLKVHAGDTLTVQLARAEPRPYTVVGVYADTKVDDSILVPWSDAQAGFAAPQANAAFIKVAPGASVADAQRQVNNLLADDPELTAQTRDEAIASLNGDLDVVLTMVQALLAVAMVIAVLGIVNTLVLSVLERTRELGLLRAIGLRRGQLVRMVTVESMVISLFGATLGIAVGAALGAAIFRALRNEGFTVLAMPWTQMAVYLLAAVVVGMLAAIFPGARATRLNVLDALAYE